MNLIERAEIMLNTQVRPSRDLRNNYADVVKSLKQHFIFDELQKSKVIANQPNVELHDAKDVFHVWKAK